MSNPPAQAAQPKAGCPGVCPVGFSIHSSMNTKQSLWAACLTTPAVRQLWFIPGSIQTPGSPNVNLGAEYDD